MDLEFTLNHLSTWDIVAIIVGIPTIDTINVMSMPKPTVDLILEMGKILTSTFLGQFLQFSQQLPTKEKLLKAPK
jgi:hypothetical protein